MAADSWLFALITGLGLAFFLFSADFVFSNKCTELGIVVLFAVERIVKRTFGMFVRHKTFIPLERTHSF